MKTLTIRALSAITAVAFIFSLIYFQGVTGLKILVFIAVALGVRELNRILFKTEESIVIKAVFITLAVATFLTTIQFPPYSILSFTCISILFCCISIIFEKNFEDLTALSLFQAKGILGFFYAGLLPSFAYMLLDIPNGMVWFLTMLAVVFAGDTFAYLTGMMWGKKKLLPNISPKKTVVGSFGGLIGSMLAGTLAAYYFLPHIPIYSLILVSLITGIVAQLGDLFESMLKRVANRKDSGSIMPGHGGVLDRIDGVLFGAPIMLAGALLLENLF